MKPSSSLQALMRQRILLQMEYAAEKATFQQQTDTLGVARQVKRGDAWFPLRIGQRFYNALNQPAMEVWRTADTDITHNFEPGRSITFFRVVSAKPSATPTLHHYRFTATVSYVEGDRMVVVLPDHAVAADLAGATTPSVRHRSILDYDYPIEWITPSELSDDAPAACREQYVGEGFGRINRGEAALTLRVLQHPFYRALLTYIQALRHKPIPLIDDSKTIC